MPQSSICAVVATVLAFGLASPAAAQQTGTVEGVVTSEEGSAAGSIVVRIAGTQAAALTDAQGRYHITRVPAGTQTVRASGVGFASTSQDVDVTAGGTVRVDLVLPREVFEIEGISVTVLRPDLQPTAELEQEQVREANPRDSGELLRSLPGVEAVRRGPVGLDPVVRGLRETEVGTYLDGTRIFPGGPARMDSPLSHLDPSAIRTIEVVKGPYALTWGAGNLSAIRVETHDLPPARPGPVHGRIHAGYDSNFGAGETSASLFGQQDAVSYWLHAAGREGSDYESGAGQTVPADFKSAEMRGKLGFRTGESSNLVAAIGYQDQQDIDYPGRLLNADYFHTVNVSARWRLTRGEGVLRNVDAMAYVNDVDHGMTNAGKPTALANPDRVPPFPLDVAVTSGVNVRGGRLAATLATASDWTVQLGGDAYRTHRLAIRRIHRADTGMLMFEDLMWPDATISDAGAFVQVARPVLERFSLSGTVRLDRVSARADTASDFFRANTEGPLDADETSVSGALTLGGALDAHWWGSIGIGTAVRTADATERFSDRIPASKAQTSAEFMGNPSLDPERSTQLDVWLDGTYPRFSASLNLFTRRIADYITVEPTELPRRLPLSPPTVYRYVNGEASFRGVEASASYAIIHSLVASASVHHLWGEDTSLDEPALGVAPFAVDLGARWNGEAQRSFVEVVSHMVSDQDRVASVRGERPTEGYTTFDLRAGTHLLGRVDLRGGILNLTDEQYVNHLNAKNPFSGLQLPEPGRVLFLDVGYAF